MMNASRKRFTLIELLVVIAVIAILMSLLLPALSRVRYRGKTILCISNLKQVGLVFSMYCDDEDGLYPATYCNKGSGCAQSSGGIHVHDRIPNKSVQGIKINEKYPVETHYDHIPLLQPYFGSRKAMIDLFMCPHIVNGYRAKYPNPNSFPYDGMVSYAMFYNMERSSEGIETAMRKSGNSWQQSNRESNCGSLKYTDVLASDRMSSGWGGASTMDGNHIPFGVTATWLNKSNSEIHAWKWSALNKGNANYLRTDGSVLNHKGINKFETDKFGGFKLNFLIPAEYFSAGP